MNEPIKTINYGGLAVKVYISAGLPVTPLQPLAEALGLDHQYELVRICTDLDLFQQLKVRVADDLDLPGLTDDDGLVTVLCPKRVFRWLCSLQQHPAMAGEPTDGSRLYWQTLGRCADVIHEYEATGSAVNFDHPKVQAQMSQQAVPILQRFTKAGGAAAA